MQILQVEWQFCLQTVKTSVNKKRFSEEINLLSGLVLNKEVLSVIKRNDNAGDNDPLHVSFRQFLPQTEDHFQMVTMVCVYVILSLR